MRLQILSLVCVALVALNSAVVYSIGTSQSRMLRVSVLSVGKGDALLIQSPRGETVLVDTGVDASILHALGTALPEWQRHIDEVVLTGSAANASGGLPALQARYTIGALVRLPTQTIRGKESREALLLTYGATSILIDENQTFSAGGAADLRISSSTPAGIYLSDGRGVWKK